MSFRYPPPGASLSWPEPPKKKKRKGKSKRAKEAERAREQGARAKEALGKRGDQGFSEESYSSDSSFDSRAPSPVFDPRFGIHGKSTLFPPEVFYQID